MRQINEAFSIIEPEEIIMICEFQDKDMHDFVIYRNDIDKKHPFHINTDFRHYNEQGKGILQIGYSYDRPLCKTIEELNDMTLKKLHSIAYRAYMDGAR